MRKAILALLIFLSLASPAMAGTDLIVPICDRFIRVHVPDHIGPNSALEIVLHPGLSTAKKVEDLMGIDAYADSNKFIVVYPYGYQPPPLFNVETWNAGGCCGPAFTTQSNDSGFVKQIINYMAENFSIDKSKVYLAGYSNGAMLSFRYICEHPEDIKGVVVMASALVMNHAFCKASIPVPVTWGYGTADTNVPPAGGIGVGGNFFPSVANTKAFFESRGVTFTMYVLAGATHAYDTISSALSAQYGTSQAQLVGGMVGVTTPPAKTYYSDAAALHPYFSDPGNTKPYEYGP